MKIIEIMKTSAEILDLKQELLLLNTQDEDVNPLENTEVLRLFNLLQFSLQELCSNYVPISTITEIASTNKKINISSIENCLKVVGVYLGEKPVNYKIVNRAILLENDGNYNVKYLTFPTLTSLNDDLDFLDNLTPDVVIMGLCSYYTLSKGMFDEFKIYYEQYVEKANSLKSLKVFSLKSRSWEWIKNNMF